MNEYTPIISLHASLPPPDPGNQEPLLISLSSQGRPGGGGLCPRFPCPFAVARNTGQMAMKEKRLILAMLSEVHG